MKNLAILIASVALSSTFITACAASDTTKEDFDADSVPANDAGVVIDAQVRLDLPIERIDLSQPEVIAKVPAAKFDLVNSLASDRTGPWPSALPAVTEIGLALSIQIPKSSEAKLLLS